MKVLAAEDILFFSRCCGPAYQWGYAGRLHGWCGSLAGLQSRKIVPGWQFFGLDDAGMDGVEFAVVCGKRREPYTYLLL